MTIASIANLEDGSSVRGKLNTLVTLANGDLINPFELGAVGNGTADDTAAFNAAIALANSSGRGIFLQPTSVFRVTSNLTAFTNGMVILGGGTIKAPNGVTCLRHFPTGWATAGVEKAATSLAVTPWKGEQNVTLVNMTNTAGLSLHQWVKVGSSTIITPKNAAISGIDSDNFWFEWARIVAIATNSSITLDRYLEGHRRGVLPGVHANYKVFGFPTTIGPVIVDVGAMADEASASVFDTNLTGRVAFLIDRGSVNGRIKVRATRWWQILVLTHGVLSELDISWESLPDITDTGIPAANQAVGYGVNCGSGSHSCVARVRGGTCRHGFTTTVQDLASYVATEPYGLGMSFYCGTTHDSRISGASAAAYDTHFCYGATLRGEAAPGAEQAASQAVGFAVQDRGFNTTISVRAHPAYWGVQLLSAQMDLSALGENITVLDGMQLLGSAGGELLRIQGDAAISENTILARACLFQGAGTGTPTGDAISIRAGFAGRLVLENCTFIDLPLRCVADLSGLAVVEVLGGSFIKPGGVTTEPFFVGSGAANRGDSTTGSWLINEFYVQMQGTLVPPGLLRNDNALATNLRVERVLTASFSLPLRSAASTGVVTITTMLDAGELRPLTTITGSMANLSSGRYRSLTGNVTAVPIANGWWNKLFNSSGVARSITPASGVCIVVETGATAGSVSIANNKMVEVVGDGTNLWVSGDVV